MLTSYILDNEIWEFEGEILKVYLVILINKLICRNNDSLSLQENENVLLKPLNPTAVKLSNNNRLK